MFPSGNYTGLRYPLRYPLRFVWRQIFLIKLEIFKHGVKYSMRSTTSV